MGYYELKIAVTIVIYIEMENELDTINKRKSLIPGY